MEYSDLCWLEEEESLAPLFDLDALCAAYSSEATAGYPTDLLDTAHTGLSTQGGGRRAASYPEAPAPAVAVSARAPPDLSGRRAGITKKLRAHAQVRRKGVTVVRVQGRGRNKTRTVHWTGSAAQWTEEELSQLARAVAENTGTPNKRGNGISWAAIKRRAPTDYPLLVKRSAEKALSKKWAKM